MRQQNLQRRDTTKPGRHFSRFGNAETLSELMHRISIDAKNDIQTAFERALKEKEQKQVQT